MNAGALCNGEDTDDLSRAVQKYTARGFHYVRITDPATMWVNLHATSQVTHTCPEVFRQFGVLDMLWCLGGMPCGLEAAFCRSRVEVIEDES